MSGDNQLKFLAWRIAAAISWTPAMRRALGEDPQLGVYRWLKVAGGLHGKTPEQLAEMYLECVFSV